MTLAAHLNYSSFYTRNLRMFRAKTTTESMYKEYKKSGHNIKRNIQSQYFELTSTHAGTTYRKVLNMKRWSQKKQKVLSKPLRNNKAIPNSYLTFWDSFSSKHTVHYETTPLEGYSYCLTPAWDKMAIVYTNSTEERFGSKAKLSIASNTFGFWLYLIALQLFSMCSL
ncbi:hypothetical protein PHYBLDRAFT_164386 [Phycomyces blakesleeanus NRRL 1555(-)]|uniref:Uncharacterized protein n=1 Tax=Phycomyces blakesleeanus (strain ATCC 8743b / DSM 1359 / FGSC 10004 / NBRC 33097 / NRRL 1555) TaxID=763407 RepID=A0A167P8N1_PHYB8|nr:hypothetical protein PHYBLDRAFT_164386 [Phycomyces blakesleeanus NRRL 1555(-)]OAD77474.1 hypothetical protein PHYBLDRAFT_164386 [Phycomyces blakesleeanus NRRL 1555(-)]|eukprot:XP_018295514.1 hypothetical protein PHYBLDRAFT_164386 [Phycomyces blakesleeanus NRRL 1555(-)]